MDSAPYQSLFKSFNKGRSKEAKSPVTGNLGQMQSEANPAPSRMTVDEILSRRKSSIDDEGGPVLSSKPIDQILSGVKSASASSRLKSAQSQNDQLQDRQDVISRKPVAEILFGAPKRMSVGSEQLKVSRMKEHPKSPPITNNYESQQQQTAVRPQSSRLFFDFSAPSVSAKQPSLLDSPANRLIRARLLQETLGIGPNPAIPLTTNFKINEDDNLSSKDYAFKAFIRNMNGVGTTTTNLIGGADNSETQTEEADVNCRWTQKPPHFNNYEKGADIRLLQMEANGVGLDPLPDIEDENVLRPKKPELSHHHENEETQLLNFVKKATKLMLAQLNGSTADVTRTPCVVLGGSVTEEAFLLEFQRGYLNKLCMHTLHCEGGHVACANVPPNERRGKGSQTEAKNIVTIWSIKDPLFPKFFLRIFGETESIKMVFPSDIVACGTNGGGLNIFDLREDETLHKPFLQDVYIRSATFHSGFHTGSAYHLTPIIGLEAVYENESTTQFITMDTENKIICWSCVRVPEDEQLESSVNSVIWSRLQIQVRQVLNLSENFKTKDLISNCLGLWEEKQTSLLIGTENGFLGRTRLNTEFKSTSEQFFEGRWISNTIRIRHIHPNVRLGVCIAACRDEVLRVFKMSTTQRIVLTLKCNSIPLKAFWSRDRHSVIYGIFEEEIIIWDLLKNTKEPTKKFPVKGVEDFHLFWDKSGEKMVMISHGGMKLFMVSPPMELTSLSSTEEKSLLDLFTKKRF